VIFFIKERNQHLVISVIKFLSLSLAAFLGYLILCAHFDLSYKTWKFASYLFIPLGFITPLLFIKMSTLSKWLFILLNIFSLQQQYTKFKPTHISSKIQEFKVLKESLPKGLEGKTIILNMDLGSVFIANTILNDKFNLVSSYYAEESHLNSYIKALSPDEAYVLFKPINFSVKQSKVMTLKQYENEQQFTLDKNILFSTLSYNNPLNVKFVKGFSGLEPWGVWTDSKESILEFEVPINLTKQSLTLIFKISPFIYDKFTHQDFSIYVNDHFVKDVNLKISEDIEINLSPKDLMDNSKIKLAFNIKRPIILHDLNPSFPETRALGLGFVDMRIKLTNA
jgi:hypothetical protein